MNETISLRLLDMNNFSIIREENFDLKNEIIQEIKMKIRGFEHLGLQFDLTTIKISNRPLFYEWILRYFFPMYDIIDCQYVGGGHPDFKLNFKSKEQDLQKYFDSFDFLIEDRKNYKFFDEIFVEIKFNNDGLHMNQFEWFLKHKEKKRIFVLFIKEDAILEKEIRKGDVF